MTAMKTGEKSRKGFLLFTRLCLVSLIIASCASAPQQRSIVKGYSFSAGDKAADTALSMVGRPYKYRGNGPSGFDCSGLVQYSYIAAGLDVPHGTGALKGSARPILTREMRKGDLLFFNERGKPYSHVGIYIGENKFVHAPSTGKTVRIDSLGDPYWKKHFLDARRFI